MGQYEENGADKVKKLVLITSLVFLFIIAGCGKNPEKEETAPSIGFSPAQVLASAGIVFTLDLNLYDIDLTIFGVSLRIEYDGDKIEFMGAQSPAEGFFEEPLVFAQDSASVVHLTVTSIQSQPEVSGTGILVELSFRGTVSGTSNLTVPQNELHFYDSDGTEIDFAYLEITNAAITVIN